MILYNGDFKVLENLNKYFPFNLEFYLFYKHLFPEIKILHIDWWVNFFLLF